MTSELNHMLSQEHVADLQRRADRERVADLLHGGEPADRQSVPIQNAGRALVGGRAVLFVAAAVGVILLAGALPPVVGYILIVGVCAIFGRGLGEFGRNRAGTVGLKEYRQ